MNRSERNLLKLSLVAFVLPLLAVTLLAMLEYWSADYWSSRRGLAPWYWPLGLAALFAGWLLVWKYTTADQVLAALFILLGITFLDVFLLGVLGLLLEGWLYGNYL